LRRYHEHSRAGGFTLIEMLVALAIVAIALSTISSSFVTMVSNSDSLKERMLARWIAENRIVEIHIKTPWPASGDQEGSLEYAGYDWKWNAYIKPSPDPDFRRLQVDVRRANEDNAAASVVSYLRNPQPGKQEVTP